MSKKANRKVEKALDKTIDFFRYGNQLNTCKICSQIIAFSDMAERYKLLELCLHVVAANSAASAKELGLMQNLANWLEVDSDRFRQMMEIVLPVNMHESGDINVVLGVTPDMNKEQMRERLNTEYRKWNARVTNFNSGIQAQADIMLEMIAQARTEYVK